MRIEKLKEKQEQIEVKQICVKEKGGKQNNRKTEKGEGRVAQSVERAVDNGKVVGSKPISPI